MGAARPLEQRLMKNYKRERKGMYFPKDRTSKNMTKIKKKWNVTLKSHICSKKTVGNLMTESALPLLMSHHNLEKAGPNN